MAKPIGGGLAAVTGRMKGFSTGGAVMTFGQTVPGGVPGGKAGGQLLPAKYICGSAQSVTTPAIEGMIAGEGRIGRPAEPLPGTKKAEASEASDASDASDASEASAGPTLMVISTLLRFVQLIPCRGRCPLRAARRQCASRSGSARAARCR